MRNDQEKELITKDEVDIGNETLYSEDTLNHLIEPWFFWNLSNKYRKVKKKKPQHIKSHLFDKRIIPYSFVSNGRS